PSTLAMASPARLFLSVLLIGLLFFALDASARFRVRCPTCFTEITENGVTKPGPCAHCKRNPTWSGDTEVCGDCKEPLKWGKWSHCGLLCGTGGTFDFNDPFSGTCNCKIRSS